METLGIPCHEVVDSIPYNQALQDKLDIGQLAFIYSSFDPIDIKLTILRNVKMSVKGANIREHMFNLETDHDEVRTLERKVYLLISQAEEIVY